MATRQIKVLHVDAEMSWRGGQQQAVYLYEGLRQRGWQTGFVCRPGSALQKYFRDHRQPQVSLAFRGEWDLAAAWRLASLARREEYSVLVLHSAHALSWGLLARLFYPSLKLVAVRRVDFSVGGNCLSRGKYRTKALKRIVAISENVRRVLVSDGIPLSKIALIRSGIDLRKFADLAEDKDFRKSWNIPENAILAGTVAAFSGHKDYPNFIRAAALAAKQEPRLYFMAVGEVILFDRMKRMAAESGLGGGMIFAGQQSEVGGFLRAFDIFVLASRKEGLGTSVLDAMALGLPVAATRAGGIPEMISDQQDGLLVPPQDPEALSAAILTLARDPALRQELGERAKLKAARFDKELMIDSYIDLLRAL